MEDALVLYMKNIGLYIGEVNVLILVLMEDALVLHYGVNVWEEMFYSLNPCFNGRCTRTIGSKIQKAYIKVVLILVLMEDALVQARR